MAHKTIALTTELCTHMSEKRQLASAYSKQTRIHGEIDNARCDMALNPMHMDKNTRGETRTRNLLLRREAPYPLGHTSMECISNSLFIVGLSGLWYIEVFNVSSMQMAVFSVGLAKILSYCDNTG